MCIKAKTQFHASIPTNFTVNTYSNNKIRLNVVVVRVLCYCSRLYIVVDNFHLLLLYFSNNEKTLFINRWSDNDDILSLFFYFCWNWHFMKKTHFKQLIFQCDILFVLQPLLFFLIFFCWICCAVKLNGN